MKTSFNISPGTFSSVLPQLPGSGHPFNGYGETLKVLFGQRVQKLSLNTGRACPNRKASTDSGCHWCLPSSFQPSYCHDGSGVMDQLEAGRRFFSRKGGEGGFLAFLQGYTPTLDDSRQLLELCHTLLGQEDVAGVILASRPDTLPPALIHGLSELAQNHFVCLEIGIESFNDATLLDMNRGHTADQARRALGVLENSGIFLGVHLILGLPGDSRAIQLGFADILSDLPVQFLKLHHLQVLKGTRLAKRLEAGETGILENLHTPGSYLEFCAEFLEHLRKDLVIDRFTNEAPLDIVVAPLWGGLKNQEFSQRLYNLMKTSGRYQGSKK